MSFGLFTLEKEMARLILDGDLWTLIELLLPPTKSRRSRHSGASRLRIARY